MNALIIPHLLVWVFLYLAADEHTPSEMLQFSQSPSFDSQAECEKAREDYAVTSSCFQVEERKA